MNEWIRAGRRGGKSSLVHAVAKDSATQVRPVLVGVDWSSGPSYSAKIYRNVDGTIAHIERWPPPRQEE